MSLWKPAPIEQEPEVRLCKWSIYEVSFNGNTEDRSRHFAGINITESYTGRASSAIVEFDEEKMIGKTRSGRIYNLFGPPGHGIDGDYVWNTWKRLNHVTEETDVSSEYYKPKSTSNPA